MHGSLAPVIIETMPKINREWHAAHPMPARPTTQQRVVWHRAHALACACRPVPQSLQPLVGTVPSAAAVAAELR